MTFVELLQRFADVNELTMFEAFQQWEKGLIDKFDLLDAWLEYEGIIGYRYKIESLFELLNEL